MNLFLALSCLQGRPFNSACTDLLALYPDGLQLTPGNVMTDVKRPGCPTRTHHGFSWKAMRQKVWSNEGHLLVKADSVHPPEADKPWVAIDETIYEVMYPGYHLGTGEAVEKAMSDGLRLAVDVSHVYIQLQSGAMLDNTWNALQRYENVAEVHVSANDGTRDTHRQISPSTFGLDWARRRNVPIILESYMHRLSESERMRQIDIVRSR
jgi:hypothetical protein